MLFSICVCVSTSEFRIKIRFGSARIIILNILKSKNVHLHIWKINLKRDNLQKKTANPVYNILDPTMLDTYVQNIHIKFYFYIRKLISI